MNANRRLLVRVAQSAFIASCAAIVLYSSHVRGDDAAVSPDGSVLNANPSQADPERNYETSRLTGKVVWLADALERRYDIRTGPEAAERVLALENDAGLFPLVEDVRGRAFRKDERLRGIDVELLVRRYEGSPMVQVIRVFSLRDGKKYELDYWCDICAIAMFELKDCECCQGPVTLRERQAEDDATSQASP